MKRYHLFILLLTVLAGCSSNSSLTSFSNRKYTRGYFFDDPGTKPIAANSDKVGSTHQNASALVEHTNTQSTQEIIAKEPLKQATNLKTVLLHKLQYKIVANTKGYTIKQVDGKLQPQDEKPGENKATPTTSKLSDIAFIMSMIVLAIFIVAIALQVELGGEFILVAAFALLPAIAGLVLGIIALANKNDHQTLAIIALVICGLVVLVFR